MMPTDPSGRARRLSEMLANANVAHRVPHLTECLYIVPSTITGVVWLLTPSMTPC